MRAFLAVDAEPKTLAIEASRRLKQLRPLVNARWTSPDQMHVTVKFLGSTTEDQAAVLSDLVRACAQNERSMDAEVIGLTAFPSPTRARVIVLELSSPRLSALATEIERACTTLSFPVEDRAFRPHLTLARLREPMDARAWLEKAGAFRGIVQLDRLALYRSDTTPQGARYTPLCEARFSGAAGGARVTGAAT
jgi:2'-5' RNA ligase